MRYFNKIFGVGLSKTGTTSLSLAFEELGISSIHYPTDLGQLDKFQSATDLLVAVSYKELDVRFPNSLFILSTREINEWLHSIREHINKLPLPSENTFAYNLRLKAFGTVGFDQDKMSEHFIRHINEVKSYFECREDQLLILEMPKDYNWDKLCAFLEVDPPLKKNFPFENIRSEKSLAGVAHKKKSHPFKKMISWLNLIK